MKTVERELLKYVFLHSGFLQDESKHHILHVPKKQTWDLYLNGVETRGGMSSY